MCKWTHELKSVWGLHEIAFGFYLVKCFDLRNKSALAVNCWLMIHFLEVSCKGDQMGRIKRIWYLSPMWAAKIQASLHIRAVSPEPPLLTHTSSESRGTFRQKARSLAPLNGWACAVKIYHDGMLEDTNLLDVSQITSAKHKRFFCLQLNDKQWIITQQFTH